MKTTNLKLLFLLLLAPLLLFGAGAEKKVVYNLTTGDIPTLETRLISAVIRNTTYYEGHLEELKAIVIIHGKSYNFFQKGQTDPKMQEIGKKLKSLHENYGVIFQICKVGMEKRKIDPKTLYPFVTIIPNATIGLIDAQHNGYAYLPIN